MVIAWSSFLFTDIIATAPSVNTSVNPVSIQADMEQRDRQKAGTHDEKWPKIQFLGQMLGKLGGNSLE